MRDKKDFFFFIVRINDVVTFVDDGMDDDIDFCDELSDEGEGDMVDNVSWKMCLGFV